MVRMLSWVLAAVALAAAAPVARADVDDQFINTLAAQGITGDRGQLIGDGQATCDNYDTPGMNGVMLQIVVQGFSDLQATRVMLVGLRAFCPEKAAAGTMAAMLGNGLTVASADPNATEEEEVARLSIRSAPATCKTLSYVPDADGVRGTIDGLMDKTGLPQSAAARVVAHSVTDSCPQYTPLVKQVVPNLP